VPCAVPGCGGGSVRSLARSEVRKAFPQLSEQGRRAPLCKDHYKQWKKATKEARELDRLAW
ncbi:MAG TPA: hypothetical protein VKT21_04475, partial [Thermoplasmata archaeon]|nr:hypothetical protein [Thermoplasmata archaeon]